MRLKDIAAIVAATQGHDFDQIHTRLRGQAFKSLLSPKSDGQEGGHPSYSRKELCRAMILVALARARLTVDDLGAVNRALSQPPQSVTPPEWTKDADGTVVSPDALGCIIEGARRNEGWTLEVTVLADPESDHALKTSLLVYAYPNDDPIAHDKRASKIQRLRKGFEGQLELSRITLEVSRLVAPLLDDEI